MKIKSTENGKLEIETEAGQRFEIEESTNGIFVMPIEPFNRINRTFATPVCFELVVTEVEE